MQSEDTAKRRVLLQDGTWQRAEPAEGQPSLDSQEACIAALSKRKEDFAERKRHWPESTQSSLKNLVKAATKRLL